MPAQSQAAQAIAVREHQTDLSSQPGTRWDCDSASTEFCSNYLAQQFFRKNRGIRFRHRVAAIRRLPTAVLSLRKIR